MSVREKLYSAYEYTRDAVVETGAAAKSSVTSIRKEDVTESIDTVSGVFINACFATQRACSTVWRWATQETPPVKERATPRDDDPDGDWEILDEETPPLKTEHKE